MITITPNDLEFPPTIPSNVTTVPFPPVFMVKFLFVLSALLTVLLNVTASELVVKTVLALKVTAPV